MASMDVDIAQSRSLQDISAPEYYTTQSNLANTTELDGLNLQAGDIRREVDVDVNTTRGLGIRAGDDDFAAGLGIDEEIKVRKRRAPLAKLDEERLLSTNGIPKLRKIAKERLKFKGKGHEFSDVAKLMNIYQLWLDDLFPKAKFADGLSIIEKLGHKKQMQVWRKDWIEQDKPKTSVEDDNGDMADFVEQESSANNAARVENASSWLEAAANANSAAKTSAAAGHTEATGTVTQTSMSQEEPEMDELDALLAEETSPGIQSQRRDEFADDEEALAELGF